MQIPCRISPRRMCNPCGYTMKMSSSYHRLLIYDVKRNSEMDGMGPFNNFHTQTDTGFAWVVWKQE